ncbi:MAG: DUF1232 domain-containing protein [Planctomycetota bacterium]
MGIARFAVAWAVAVIAAFYLLNPNGGKQEFIPDQIRYWGNLDELVAVILLISALRSFGVDVCRFFGDEEKDASRPR